MKLTTEQLKACATGVAYFTEEGGYLRLHRFTAAQEEMYRLTNPEHYDRSASTSGVMLEFDTDSTSMSLSVRCRKGSSRHWFVHSIFVNGERVGELLGTYTPPEAVEAQGEWTLGEGSKRVKLVFPWSACSEIKALTLDDGAVFSPVKREKKALIYGDSITQGYDAALPENAYANLLAEHLGMDCINKAIGGEIFRPALAELADDFQPECITVAYGTNDWSGVNNEKLENNARAFLAALRKNYPHTRIILLSPVWRGDWQRERPAVAFREIPALFEKLAEEVGNAEVIDCFGFIPQHPACFSPDVLHPNDRGFAHYADGLKKNI